MTPEEKAAGARELLNALRCLHDARMDYVAEMARVRRILVRCELPMPAPLLMPGGLENVINIGMAVNDVAEWCEHGAALFTELTPARRACGDDPAGAPSPAPAGEPSTV